MKIRKELWFGFTLVALILIPIGILMPWGHMTNGHYGLLMLALIVVGIMMGFPTAFTLMGMGVFFGWLAYRSVNPALAERQILDLMVQRAYYVMSNDVLIAVPLFVFMGYLVERAALIDKLFKALHLAMARVPGSLAVATIVTCAIFATATGIIGAVVTLMGLLAFPAMLKAGYNVKIGAGAITAGGCLGILIPPSVLLILYGATAGVSVVQLYAGAFFPGIMLAALYVGYIIILALWKPSLMPPLPMSERLVALPALAQSLSQRGRNALVGLTRALVSDVGVAKRGALGQLIITLLPLLFIAAILGVTYSIATTPVIVDTTGLVEAGSTFAADAKEESSVLGAQANGNEGGLSEPPADDTKPVGVQEPPKADTPASATVTAKTAAAAATASSAPAPTPQSLPAPLWFWVMLGLCVVLLTVMYLMWNWQRLEVFKMLLTSFFPLALLILAVLGSIVAGLATPTEAAAVGALGGLLLAAVYRFINHWREKSVDAGLAGVAWTTLKDLGSILKDSSFLTGKTTAMVCWLFVGSSIFSAAFALLGGQQIVENWVLSLGLTPVQFMLLAQAIIFILGWPLEWTEIIIIFMPIFVPLLPKFGVDPLFFGLLVALNLQTAFLSPPVAMAAFYLKGVSPPHVTLNQIFAGMMPFMAIQVFAIFLLYMFPAIGLWLPHLLYK